MRVLFIHARYKVRLVQESVRYLSPSVEAHTFVPVGNTWELLASNIAGEVERIKPDLVWTDHSFFGGHVPDTVPFVLVLRGDWWTEYSALPPAVLANFLQSQEYKAHVRGFEKAKRIIPLSVGLMKQVKKHFPNKACTVIPQGIDSSKWKPTPPTGALKHPSIAIIQNHSIRPKFEGLLQFVPVMRSLQRFHFYISEGQSQLEPQTYLPRLKDAAKDLPNVTFIDIQTPEAVNNLFTETDLYVLPSGLDWCPTTLLEAGLMQRITVASRIPGIREVVREGVNGFTAENGNAQQWTVAVEKAQSLDGAKAREYVVKHFDWRVIMPQFERVFHAVVRDARHG